MQSISTDVIMKLLTLYYADSDSNRWRARWRAEAAAANSGMQRMQRLWHAADGEDAVLQLSGDERLSEIREYAGTFPDAEESVNKCNLQHSGCEKLFFAFDF